MCGPYPEDLEAGNGLAFSLRSVRPLVDHSGKRPTSNRRLDHRQSGSPADPAEIVVVRWKPTSECCLRVFTFELNGDVLLVDPCCDTAAGRGAETDRGRGHLPCALPGI